MKAVPIVGRGLACALGLDVAESVATLRAGGRPAGSHQLPGGMGGGFPYFSIPFEGHGWYQRARELVTRVAAEAGAQSGCKGALFLATSSFDVGAVESGVDGAAVGDYRPFIDAVTGWLDWAGPVHAISTACTSSLNALIAAQALLNSGAVDEALVLGIELENRLTLGGFAALQLLSRTISKPFGAGRDGLVLGESVAALRLAAQGDSAWRLLGGANVVDGTNPTGASESALGSMFAQALAASGLAADQIDLVKVQAAGSPGNDLAEARALRAAFDPVPALVSLKSTIGHTMGASGAAEIALLTACLENGAWPDPADAADPELGVRLAKAPPPVRRLLATILGFGGSHAAVALERT
ncbi:MAG: beta-ketoacyl synthase [Rhodocyclales bacterium]|nr:beta-ketoacyl synthase [Rhodocyclales bacterium]